MALRAGSVARDADKTTLEETVSVDLVSPPPQPALVTLPVEIFDAIVSNLSREDVRALRLVSRQVEPKASRGYYQSVVVPFTPELFGEPTEGENGPKTLSTDVPTEGMRTFQYFGPQVLQFALSLNLDEDKLANPPYKPTQKAVVAFWGVYRWPLDKYPRYRYLERLENAGDELPTIRAALGCLTRACNFGLCCDPGLGFLLGPDRVGRAAYSRQPVFSPLGRHGQGQGLASASSNLPARAALGNYDIILPRAQTVRERVLERRHQVLEMMVRAAGVADDEIEKAISLILTREMTTLDRIDLELGSRNVGFTGNDTTDAVIRQSGLDRESLNVMHPLVPAYLTQAQREFLLELDWAHRAVIQSYILGVADNAASGRFDNLSTLTIAKIAGSHVDLLCRKHLWQAMTTLKHVSIRVVADWRQVSSPVPGFVTDTEVSPAESVTAVFKLLNEFIGKQPNIEHLHFEWICGGEFAPGIYQRNLYVLPAPFFEKPKLMLSPSAVKTQPNSLLLLPFIKHLSLKNCWASPHVMLQMVRQLTILSLKKLELESVSLSGPPTNEAQLPLSMSSVHLSGCTMPILGPQRARNHLIRQGFTLESLQPGMPAGGNHGTQQTNGTGVGTGVGAGAGVSVPNSDPGDGLSTEALHPNWFTWAGFMDQFTPGTKLRHTLAGRIGDHAAQSSVEEELAKISPYIPDPEELLLEEGDYQMESISFRSCGYVAVDTRFLKTRAIAPEHSTRRMNEATMLHTGIRHLVQYCSDERFGTISPFIKTLELRQLAAHFNMRFMWRNVYDTRVVDDARADGVELPGTARFTGDIRRS